MSVSEDLPALTESMLESSPLLKRLRADAKVQEWDLLFVLRRDRRRYARGVELLEVFKEQKTATSGKAPEDYANDSE